MAKSVVKVNPRLDDQINKILWEIEGQSDAKIGDIAHEVAKTARDSSAFDDYKYTAREPERAKANRKGNPKNLRKTIKAWWSKQKQCWVVSASASNAHLVEFGHAQVSESGKVVGSVAAHPFLRPAVDDVVLKAKRILEA